MKTQGTAKKSIQYVENLFWSKYILQAITKNIEFWNTQYLNTVIDPRKP